MGMCKIMGAAKEVRMCPKCERGGGEAEYPLGWGMDQVILGYFITRT